MIGQVPALARLATAQLASAADLAADGSGDFTPLPPPPDLDILVPGVFACLASAGLGTTVQTSTNLPELPDAPSARSLLCGQAVAADCLGLDSRARKIQSMARYLLPPLSQREQLQLHKPGANRSPCSRSTDFDIIPN